MAEKQEFLLAHGDSAIIIRANGDEEIILPRREETEEIGDSEWRVLVAAVFLSNEELFEQVAEELRQDAADNSTVTDKKNLN